MGVLVAAAVGISLLYFLFSPIKAEDSPRPMPTPPAPKPPRPDIPFYDLFEKYAHQEGIPVRLIVSVAAHESGFNPRARNEESAADARKGRDVDSIGLCQILYPDTARDYLGSAVTEEQVFDPATNVMIGCKHLRKKLDKYPQLRDGFPADAVAAYNSGTVFTYADGTYRNQLYVNAVLTQWRSYAGLAL